MKLSEFKVDVDRIEEGTWVENIPEFAGVRLKVRGANNRDWRRLQGRLLAAIPRRQRVGNQLTPEALDKLNAQLLLQTSLLDWDGMFNEDDSPMPYSKDMATKLLTDPQYGKFREAALYAANFVADATSADLSDDAKN